MRHLSPEERTLVTFLLASKADVRPVNDLVQDMRDGGMGSLRFAGPDNRAYGRTLAQAEFRDADGVAVSPALHLDTDGELFELDIWKVDFSPLVRIPPLDQAKITK